jgi:hypothetical protein
LSTKYSTLPRDPVPSSQSHDASTLSHYETSWKNDLFISKPQQESQKAAWKLTFNPYLKKTVEIFDN